MTRKPPQPASEWEGSPLAGAGVWGVCLCVSVCECVCAWLGSRGMHIPFSAAAPWQGVLAGLRGGDGLAG